MSPHLLDRLDAKLHHPKWFWPVVYVLMFALFLVSSFEGVPQ